MIDLLLRRLIRCPENGIAKQSAERRIDEQFRMVRETRLGEQYGGVMIWSILGDASAPHSLLTVIQNNLKTNRAARLREFHSRGGGM